MDVVDDASRLEQQVGINLQLVQLPVGLPKFRIDIRAVSMGEDASDVAYVVVDDVALDTVAGRDTFGDVVFHLPTHVAVRRSRDSSND